MTDAWEELTGSFDPALVIVTTALDGERAGCLVGFHTQSSMDPPRYCVWLSKANHTARVAQRASHLAVHAVPVGELALVQRFGSETGDAVD
ncbi:flavin reductase family protein [Flexivirga sp.]|uniref:flavin reductase family protein n=1 Tax=Flexivirga sp. TaxID=1962927 RepID=UPI003F7DBC10